MDHLLTQVPENNNNDDPDKICDSKWKNHIDIK